jgi:hypothetical protein
VLSKIAPRLKIAKATRFHILKPNPGSIPKRFKSRLVFLLTILDQPHTFPQHFACVLVATGGNESVDDLGLVVRQDNISGPHGVLLQLA